MTLLIPAAILCDPANLDLKRILSLSFASKFRIPPTQLVDCSYPTYKKQLSKVVQLNPTNAVGGLFISDLRRQLIESNTEPLHSPPTPIPWIKRNTINSTGPQTPICAYVGTKPTAKVARPVSSSVAISADFRPMRSP